MNKTHLAKLMASRKVSVAAKKTGISETNLRSFIAGESEMTARDAVALGDYLEVEPSTLLTAQNEEQLAKLKDEPAKPLQQPRTASKSPMRAKEKKPDCGSGEL